MWELRLVPLDQLVTWSDNPSLRTADTPLWREFLAHVRTYGQLMPIVVTPASGGRYQVVDGHRRVAALRMLGYTAAWALIVPWTWERAIEAYGYAEQIKLPWTGRQLGEIVRRMSFPVARAMLRPRAREVLARAYEAAMDTRVVDEALERWGPRGLAVALRYVGDDWPIDRVLRAMMAHGSYRDLEDQLKGVRGRDVRRARAHALLAAWEGQTTGSVAMATGSDGERSRG